MQVSRSHISISSSQLTHSTKCLDDFLESDIIFGDTKATEAFHGLAKRVASVLKGLRQTKRSTA